MYRDLAVIFVFVAIQESSSQIQRDNFFYVYDWPETITNSWPQLTSENSKDFSRSFYSNYGAGPVVNSSTGLHKTFQYGTYFLVVY